MADEVSVTHVGNIVPPGLLGLLSSQIICPAKVILSSRVKIRRVN